jgi:16S rRNA (guanine527-N7)-methyltransferase
VVELERGLEILRSWDSGIDQCLSPRTEEVFRLLAAYLGEIERFNPRYKLVGAKSRQDLIVRHLLDSLAPLGILRRLLHRADAPVADVGSGAGLPGIPLAIGLSDVPFTLIERMGKRAGFLRNTQGVLGLPRVKVEEGDMAKSPEGRFALVTFRAVSPIQPDFLAVLFRLLAPDGVVAAYKGRRDKIEREMESVRGIVKDWEIHPTRVPFLDEERHLLIIRRPV